MPQTVAVVGAGVSGLTAAYLLQRQYDVTLFEAEPRLGGHAHTHDVPTPEGRAIAVDTGFIVHNDRTYPNLVRLFGELGVETHDTEMSMSVRCDGCGLEYAGARGLSGLFPSRSALRPAYLRMLVEVTRFHRRARALLERDESEPKTLGEFLVDGGYSPYFVRHFVVPVVSCVWSCPPGTALLYPARYLFAFLANHGLLSVTGSPQWRTVVGGSRSYVERAAKELTAVQVSTPVRGVGRTADGVLVRDDADDVRRFDRVVIATHADTALAMLEDPTSDEQAVLGAFGYSVNDTVLHTDASILPRNARARASWNYLLDDCAGENTVKVTYDMGRLQGLGEPRDYLVTLNATDRLQDSAVLARMSYTHPVYTRESVAAQGKLASLAGDRTAFAGAYHGWGFHEDGCLSGVRAAEHFGVTW